LRVSREAALHDAYLYAVMEYNYVSMQVSDNAISLAEIIACTDPTLFISILHADTILLQKDDKCSAQA